MVSTAVLDGITAKLKTTQLADDRLFSILWSSGNRWPSKLAKDQQRNVVILDASFDPITYAHCALARLPHNLHYRFPEKYPPVTDTLLVHGVRNADKGSTATLASSSRARTEQRFHMIALAASSLTTELGENLAIACCSEPLIAPKATLIDEYIRKQDDEEEVTGKEDGGGHGDGDGNEGGKVPATRRNQIMTFVLGWDTIVRFFNPKYYNDIHETIGPFFRKQNCRIITARRAHPDNGDIQKEQEFLESDAVSPYYREGFLQIVDLENYDDYPTSIPLPEISSTQLRNIVYQESKQDKGSSISDALQYVPESVLDYIINAGLYMTR